MSEPQVLSPSAWERHREAAKAFADRYGSSVEVNGETVYTGKVAK